MDESDEKKAGKSNLNVSSIGKVDRCGRKSKCFGRMAVKGELSSPRSWLYLVIFPCTSLLTWGIISAFPVLFVAFLDKFQKSRSHTSTIGSLQVGLLYMLTVIPGYLIPRYGFRVNIMIGSVFVMVGFISSIFVTTMYYLYFTIGVFTSLGASFLMTAADSAPLVVFKKWRALATVLSSTAASVGFAVLPVATNYLIRTYGLQGALLLLAGIILQCIVLGMLYPPYLNNLKNGAAASITDAKRTNDNVMIPASAKYFKIVKSPSFWCVSAATLAINSLSDGCRLFLVDRAIVQGISESAAVWSLSLWGIFSALCRFLVQIPFINRSPRRKQISLVVMTLGWSLVTFSSIAFTSYSGFVAYCILAGCFHGISNILWYLVLADTMEGDLVVSAYSLQCFIAGSFVIFSVPTAGMMFDSTQSYDVPYIIYGCLGLFGTICESFIPYFERKKQKRTLIL